MEGCALRVPVRAIPLFCMKFHCGKRRLRRSAAVGKIMTARRGGGRTGGPRACGRGGSGEPATPQTREPRKGGREEGRRRVGENVVIHIALSRKLFLT